MDSHTLQSLKCQDEAEADLITLGSMGKEKRAAPVVAAGGSKERKSKSQKSQYDSSAPVAEGFEAKRAVPKSKHHSYFEFVENDGKKKKLEYQVDLYDSSVCLPNRGADHALSDYPETATTAWI